MFPSFKQRWFSCVLRDNTVRTWDVETGKVLYVLEGHTGWVTCLALSSNGMRLFSGSHDSTVRVWDVAANSLSDLFLYRFDSGVQSMFVTHENVLYGITADGTVFRALPEDGGGFLLDKMPVTNGRGLLAQVVSNRKEVVFVHNYGGFHGVPIISVLPTGSEGSEAWTYAPASISRENNDYARTAKSSVEETSSRSTTQA